MKTLCALLWLVACAMSNGKLTIQDYDEEQERVVDIHDLLHNLSASLNAFRNDLREIKEDVSAKLAQFERKMKENCDSQTKPVLRNCADVYTHSSQVNGVYVVQPVDSWPFEVYCDMTIDGGGWTVFQKRIYKLGTSFNRRWQEYKDGFGGFDTGFWLGNEKLYLLTRYGEYELRIDLKDSQNRKGFAKYSTFQVRSDKEMYSLHVGGYSGNVGDSFSEQKGMRFSTKDVDNDCESRRSCAWMHGGGWWYCKCNDSNLNGMSYLESYRTGIVWNTWTGDHHFITHTEMKIRPRNWIP